VKGSCLGETSKQAASRVGYDVPVTNTRCM
jgi:hypothetical protein